MSCYIYFQLRMFQQKNHTGSECIAAHCQTFHIILTLSMFKSLVKSDFIQCVAAISCSLPPTLNTEPQLNLRHTWTIVFFLKYLSKVSDIY